MRYLFTDGYNSFWHVAFGATAIMLPIIVVVFVAYQLNQGDKNVPIDIGEFFVGYVIMMLILHKASPKSETPP